MVQANSLVGHSSAGHYSVGHIAKTGALMSQPLNHMDASISGRLIGETREPEEIETRFGKITINHENPIVFEKGLLGMPERNLFKLLTFPVRKFARFRLLQSLDDYGLSFITLPLELGNELITREDIKEAAADLDISEENLELYLIVNVYRESAQVRLSVNVRAPIFVDKQRNRATQAVLRNNSYQVRQPLGGEMITALS